MNVKQPFVLVISKAQWREWDLDDPAKYLVALSAFYCGYGQQVVSQLVQIPNCADAQDIVRVAPLLGMEERDKIITRAKSHADSYS